MPKKKVKSRRFTWLGEPTYGRLNRRRVVFYNACQVRARCWRAACVVCTELLFFSSVSVFAGRLQVDHDVIRVGFAVAVDGGDTEDYIALVCGVWALPGGAASTVVMCELSVRATHRCNECGRTQRSKQGISASSGFIVHVILLYQQNPRARTCCSCRSTRMTTSLLPTLARRSWSSSLELQDPHPMCRGFNVHSCTTALQGPWRSSGQPNVTRCSAGKMVCSCRLGQRVLSATVCLTLLRGCVGVWGAGGGVMRACMCVGVYRCCCCHARCG